MQGAGLVIVEVREEIKMQQKPNKQKNKVGVQGRKNVGARSKHNNKPKINKQRYGGARL